MSVAELEKVTKAWLPISRAVRVPHTEEDYRDLVQRLDRLTAEVGEDENHPHLDRLNRWTIDGDTVRYLGLIITAIGGFVRVATVFELGHRFSIFVTVQPDHRLKTDGFYRFVRHPSYLGALLVMTGWALVFRSVIGLLLTAAMCVPIIALIRAEEEFLVREFGEQYRSYQQHTRWRLLPLIY